MPMVATTQTAGFAVQGRGGLFLSRNKNWVNHHRKTERAWVFTQAELEADIQNDAPWIDDVYRFLPAIYNPALDGTTIVGEPISIEKFCWKLVDESVGDKLADTAVAVIAARIDP